MSTSFSPSRRAGLRTTGSACLLLLVSAAAPGAPGVAAKALASGRDTPGKRRK